MHPANVVNMSEPVKKASGIIAILGDMLIQPMVENYIWRLCCSEIG